MMGRCMRALVALTLLFGIVQVPTPAAETPRIKVATEQVAASGEPVSQRTFFDDYRDIDGLVIPHQVDLEFGHRLESMTVKQVEVDAEIAKGSFSPPKAAPAE